MTLSAVCAEQRQLAPMNSAASITKASFCWATANPSSSGGESHPSALTEPDVKLSPHPAPTIQHPAAHLAPSEQTGCVHVVQYGLTSAWTHVHDAGISCTSAAPRLRGPH